MSALPTGTPAKTRPAPVDIQQIEKQMPAPDSKWRPAAEWSPLLRNLEETRLKFELFVVFKESGLRLNDLFKWLEGKN